MSWELKVVRSIKEAEMFEQLVVNVGYSPKDYLLRTMSQ